MPCATSASTLHRDLLRLTDRLRTASSAGVSSDGGNLPTVLDTTHAPRRRFGEVYREHWDLWQALQQQSGMPFDLLYAPRAWEMLLAYAANNNATPPSAERSLRHLWPDHHVLYYHCGGCEGNASQVPRYQRLLSPSPPDSLAP